MQACIQGHGHPIQDSIATPMAYLPSTQLPQLFVMSIIQEFLLQDSEHHYQQTKKHEKQIDCTARSYHPASGRDCKRYAADHMASALPG